MNPFKKEINIIDTSYIHTDKNRRNNMKQKKKNQKHHETW